MSIKKYDKVRLRNGRTGTIVEVLKENTEYLIDINLPGPDWETIEIHHEDVAEILK